MQDLLAVGVDAVGTVFGTLLAPETPAVIEQLADDSLSALENIPFDWTEIEADRKRAFVKVDKSNPSLDAMADQWLRQHDPDLVEGEKAEEDETKKLFVTGPKKE